MEESVSLELARVRAEVAALELDAQQADTRVAEIESVLRTMALAKRQGGLRGVFELRFLLLSVGFALLIAGGFALEELLGSTLTALAFAALIYEAVQ